jgi:pimeloyl-ACP methyl ester carboxylesterase
VTLILLHAFPLDERMWEPQRELGGVAPSLYGRGATMESWAASILQEVDGDVDVVGASMGGYCALAMARQAPERVRRLLLAGSRPQADSPDRRAARGDTIRTIREQGPDALWDEMKPKLFADESRADPSLLHREPDDLVDAVSAIRDRTDAGDLAAALGDRLLFLVGDRDPFVSVSDLRDYPVRELEGCGHLPNIERSAEFNEAVRELVGA